MTNLERADIEYMRRCFELARRGAGSVSPNPLVGAVIVKNGKIVAEGWHREPGAPHAEADAIANASCDLTGATLYCNLEPCRHTKKRTPPCVPMIIRAGIKRVVISTIDPNREVAGKGLSDLKSAGIEVVPGLCEKDGNELNKFFFKHIVTGLPYVTIKTAQSSDGYISGKQGYQTWLTCTEAGKFVHSLRSEYDAVLVGANTIRIDNPELTVRLVEGRNPRRVIIDGNLTTPRNSKVFTDGRAQTFLFTSKSASGKEFDFHGAEIEVLEGTHGKITIHSVIKRLGDLGMISVLVEGGAEIFQQFIDEKLFDELIVITAPKELGGGLPGVNPHEIKKLKLERSFNLGVDRADIYTL